MEHEEAASTHAVERYLLDEMPPEQRDQFEDHYFGCAECAEAVRIGAVFVANGQALARENARHPSRPGQVVEMKARPGRWISQVSIAASVVLAAVLGYQNFVTIPSLKAPRPVSRALLRPASRGAGIPVKQAPGSALDLTLEWSGAHSGAAYRAEVKADGRRVAELPRLTAQDDAVEILIPEGLAAGDYEILVRSLSPNGDSAEFPIQVVP